MIVGASYFRALANNNLTQQKTPRARNFSEKKGYDDHRFWDATGIWLIEYIERGMKKTEI